MLLKKTRYWIPEYDSTDQEISLSLREDELWTIPSTVFNIMKFDTCGSCNISTLNVIKSNRVDWDIEIFVMIARVPHHDATDDVALDYKYTSVTRKVEMIILLSVVPMIRVEKLLDISRSLSEISSSFLLLDLIEERSSDLWVSEINFIRFVSEARHWSLTKNITTEEKFNSIDILHDEFPWCEYLEVSGGTVSCATVSCSRESVWSYWRYFMYWSRTPSPRSDCHQGI